MTVTLTRFSQTELLGTHGILAGPGNTIGFAASGIWLEMICNDANQSALDRLEDMRQMRGRMFSCQPAGPETNGQADEESVTSKIVLDGPAGRLADLCEHICRAIEDHPEGVLISISLGAGRTHAVAGYRRRSPERLHFFDPQQGEYVADLATDLHLAVTGLVASRLRDLYATVESIQPLPRQMH